MMAHYAIVDTNNIVTRVFVGRDENDSVEGVIDWEQYYAPKGFLCRRTSYNTRGGIHNGGGVPFRKNYAGIGYTFDEIRDAFIPPQPFLSWTLDEDSCLWVAPQEMPDDGLYRWDEESLLWVLEVGGVV